MRTGFPGSFEPPRLRHRSCNIRGPHRAGGVAMIELALVLPILVMLVLGVIDFSRAIQYNNVLVSLTREGANLAARTSETPQFIVKALMNTASPLNMNTDGMMYITRLVGCPNSKPGCPVGDAQVEEQYRNPSGGKVALKSRIWASCPSWQSSGANAGTCNVPATRPVVRLSVPLTPGETVYAAEAFYDYTLFTRYLISEDPQLYSLTIL